MTPAQLRTLAHRVEAAAADRPWGMTFAEILDTLDAEPAPGPRELFVYCLPMDKSYIADLQASRSPGMRQIGIHAEREWREFAEQYGVDYDSVAPQPPEEFSWPLH